jgi:ABC-2 type transport system permease protein
MAVYRRGYQRYQGPIASRWTRFAVLPRYAWKRLFQQRMILLITVISMVWPLLCAVFIYLTNHADLLKGMSKQFQDFIQVNGTFFFTYMAVQSVFAVFLAALAGPGLIAPDLANNALPLYFSRPLSRSEYVIARFATILGILSLITWIPGLLLFGMQTGMADSKWFNLNWQLAPAMVAGFAIWLLLVSMVALASSAVAKVKIVSGALVLGFFFILSGASVMINGVFRVTWGHALNPSWASRRIWCFLLSVDPAEGPGAAVCAGVLVGFILLLGIVLLRRLRPVEVIS